MYTERSAFEGSTHEYASADWAFNDGPQPRHRRARTASPSV